MIDVAGDLPVPGGPVIPAAELQWRFSRSSGPGGQSVNTTDSRVELSWDVAESAALSQSQRQRLRARLADRLRDGVLTVVAAEHRSQWQNRRAVRERLAQLLAASLAPPPRRRRPTRPSRSEMRRRAAAKSRRSQLKADRRPPRPDD